jgi:hypothetical protein
LQLQIGNLKIGKQKRKSESPLWFQFSIFNLQFAICNSPIIVSGRRKRIDHSASRDRPAAVQHSSGNDRDVARLHEVLLVPHDELHAALEQVRQLLVRMLVDGDVGFCIKGDIAGGHPLAVHVAAANARENLAFGDAVNGSEGHLNAECKMQNAKCKMKEAGDELPQ